MRRSVAFQMRILFATTAGAGHVGPIVPFARACERAGHDVIVAGPGSAAELVRRARLRFVPVGEPEAREREAAWAPVWSPDTSPGTEHVIQELFIGLQARAALPGMLQAIADWRPDTVVRETCEFSAALAAERLDVPQAQIGIHQSSLTDAAEWLLAIAAPALDDLRAEAGLAPDPTAELIGRAPVFTGAPRALEIPPRRLPCVTIGNRRDSAELGPVPPRVRVERWVSQAELMPHTAAMVGHGGSGSTLIALAAGVPVALIPLFVDGPANARRVAEIGAGIELERGLAGTSGLAAAIARLLGDPSYREAAGRVAGEIRALPPVDRAVEEIVATARRRDLAA